MLPGQAWSGAGRFRAGVAGWNRAMSLRRHSGGCGFREYAGLIADHDAIVKVLLVELGASGDSVAAIASDDSLSRDARSARIGRVCLAMDRRIASAFAPLLERCPTDFISRQAPGWATIFDPALSSHRGRIERMLEDFSSRGDSI